MGNKTYSDCEKLLREVELRLSVKEHCITVSELAAEIAEALNKKGCSLDSELCRRAGLLHDICRTEDEHDKKGRDFLEKAGFPEEAEIVGAHMGRGIDFDSDSANEAGLISEKDVVYYADKLVAGTQRVTVAQRYEAALKKYGSDPEAAKDIKVKYTQALSVKRKIDNILGHNNV